MSKRTTVEVEPLSELRWAKIERSLFTEWDKRSASWKRSVTSKHGASLEDGVPLAAGGNPWGVWVRMGLVAGVLISAAALVALFSLGSPDRTVLDQPSRILTGTEASHLALPGLSLDVEPDSAVVVGAESPQGLLVVLDRGTIVCQVNPRSKDAPLVVQAGAVRVRVIGTRFSVTRVGDAARVRVYHGTVEVTESGVSRLVHAGQQWSGADVASTAVPVGAPQPPAVRGDVELGVGEHADQVNGPRDSSTEPGPIGPAHSQRRAARVATRQRSERPAAALPPTPTEPSSADVGVRQSIMSRQEVFERATRLERSNPTRAAQLYRSLEAGSDSWGQNALFARGRLAASRGSRREAQQLLNHYLQRFPRGSNAEDARALLRRLE